MWEADGGECGGRAADEGLAGEALNPACFGGNVGGGHWHEDRAVGNSDVMTHADGHVGEVISRAGRGSPGRGRGGGGDGVPDGDGGKDGRGRETGAEFGAGVAEAVGAAHFLQRRTAVVDCVRVV